MKKMNKKGEGLVSGLVSGTGQLVIMVIVTLLVVSTIIGANLLTGSEEDAATNMSANLTAGINEISTKIPTILLIAAVVLLFGVIAILVTRSRAMAGGGSL